MNPKYLIFTLGPTNAGKSTFLDDVKSRYRDQTYLIQVGKILRAKYPPEHFKGQAAPANTEQEALDILWSEYAKASDYPYVLIDGQPRNLNQAKLLNETEAFHDRTCFVFYIWASKHERIKRAALRDKGKSLDLALARMSNDEELLKGVLEIFNKYPVIHINTEKQNPLDWFEKIVVNAGKVEEKII